MDSSVGYKISQFQIELHIWHVQIKYDYTKNPFLLLSHYIPLDMELKILESFGMGIVNYYNFGKKKNIILNKIKNADQLQHNFGNFHILSSNKRR
jgi:hypothetical protein